MQKVYYMGLSSEASYCYRPYASAYRKFNCIVCYVYEMSRFSENAIRVRIHWTENNSLVGIEFKVIKRDYIRQPFTRDRIKFKFYAVAY